MKYEPLIIACKFLLLFIVLILGNDYILVSYLFVSFTSKVIWFESAQKFIMSHNHKKYNILVGCVVPLAYALSLAFVYAPISRIQGTDEELLIEMVISSSAYLLYLISIFSGVSFSFKS